MLPIPRFIPIFDAFRAPGIQREAHAAGVSMNGWDITKNFQVLLRLETEQHYGEIPAARFALFCLLGLPGCSGKLNGELVFVALAEVQAFLFRKLARKNW